ncbi:MAG: helix-turn-helix domain-containing protein [Myxococcaceae bacterium]|nr:helix-turn-helix domain-containing protein [Myxococcaceae bacterium]
MIERIGEIVRAARERENCSLVELASRSGVPLPILTALEQGQPGITTTQLDAVAEALSLDPTALLNGREVPRRVPSVFLRHASMQDFDDRDRAVLDDALAQGRSLANLRALLGEPALALQAGAFTQREAAADRQGAPALDGHRLAREVRRRLGDDAEPLGDVRGLLEERFGVAVLVRPFESSRVTVVGVRAETCGAIVLSAGDIQRAWNPLLTRVYLAHDLCHVLFDPSQGGLHIVIDSASDRRSHAAEQRARAFAAELLLPLAGLTQLLGTPREVNEPSAALELIARARSRFGTPHEIAANHLCNHRFIDRQLREWLEAERTLFAGTPPQTTLPEDGAPSRLVAEYVERAHRGEFLTDGEARTILGIDPLAPLPWDEVEL